jgi:multidrug efflux system membrane fusion protein
VSNRLFCWFAISIFLFSFGCQRKHAEPAKAQPPAVPVSQVVQREVTDYVYFTGRSEAIQLVDIRPRVTGYVVKVPFREGAEVKKGDLLFEIDPRPYQAQLDQAEGQVKLYEAQLKLAKVTLKRDQTIAKTPGAISLQQIDQDEASVEEAEARVKAFNASLEVYKLNLEFTQVTSPIDGQVSRYYLTVGNLVNQDQTLLTTVVSLDPIYVYFDIDEPTVLRVRKAINEGKIKRYLEGKIPVNIRLQGEDGYPHQGTLNFVNNQVNPATGSLLVRGIFDNPIPESGTTRLLSPGMFVRVQLPLGQPHPAILVIDRAIGSDQGLKYVYVVKSDNRIEYRRVTTGSLQDDGLRVITEGLKADESVVVGGLQQVHPNLEIKPDRTSMPTLNQPQVNAPPEDTAQKKGA